MSLTTTRKLLIKLCMSTQWSPVYYFICILHFYWKLTHTLFLNSLTGNSTASWIQGLPENHEDVQVLRQHVGPLHKGTNCWVIIYSIQILIKINHKNLIKIYPPCYNNYIRVKLVGGINVCTLLKCGVWLMNMRWNVIGSFLMKLHP